MFTINATVLNKYAEIMAYCCPMTHGSILESKESSKCGEFDSEFWTEMASWNGGGISEINVIFIYTANVLINSS